MACSPAGSACITARSGSGCAVMPVSGGMTQRQVQLICDSAARRPLATPSYALAIIDEFRAQGCGPARLVARNRLFRRGAVDQPMRGEIEGRLRHRRLDNYGLSEVIGPGVASECIETKDGLHVWEDHFYPGDDRPGDRRRAARRRVRRTRLHLADQGGDAGHPLPHRRPDAAAAWHRPLDAADREDPRARRRHDRSARRQYVPDPDRGAASCRWRASPAITRSC